MTPQEALAQAMRDAELDGRPTGDEDPWYWDEPEAYAAAILDALPEGCELVTPDVPAKWHRSWQRIGAQQERERLRAALPSFSTSRIGTGEYVPLRFVYDILADPEDDR